VVGRPSHPKVKRSMSSSDPQFMQQAQETSRKMVQSGSAGSCFQGVAMRLDNVQDLLPSETLEVAPAGEEEASRQMPSAMCRRESPKEPHKAPHNTSKHWCCCSDAEVSVELGRVDKTYSRTSLTAICFGPGMSSPQATP
jgi:hypothetical protein